MSTQDESQSPEAIARLLEAGDDPIPAGLVGWGMKKDTPPTTQPPVRDTRTKYDWVKWMNGEYHILQRGVDFPMAVSRFVAQVYRKAQDNDMFAKTERLENEGLGIMFAKDRTSLAREWAAAADPDLGLPDELPD